MGWDMIGRDGMGRRNTIGWDGTRIGWDRIG